MTREDANAPRAISMVVPLTTENRGTEYEVQMPRLPWLRHQSFANVQGIAAYEHTNFSNAVVALSWSRSKESRMSSGGTS